MPEPSPGCLSQRGRAHLAGEPWAQRALGFSGVWDLTRGQGVTVAVVDSGIDYTPQLAGRVTRIDLTGGNGEDCIPHGTIVASIIAARDARAQGIPFYGVAPAARILSVRVQQQEGTAGESNAARGRTLADIAKGIRYAVVKHARVINVSIQVSAPYPALHTAIEFALRHNVVVVAAAGNDTPGGGQGPFYPASYPGVLSVNAADQNGQLGGFDVNRTPVSVTAPGVNIASDYPGGFDPANNGTSFAAAFVSGEAALVRAAYPGLSATQVVHRIIATAAGRTGAHTGAGMINPVQAVTEVLPQQGVLPAPPHRVPVPRPTGVNSFTRTVALSVTGGAMAAAALVAIGALVVPRGRRRHWRPGRLGADTGAPAPAGPGANAAGARTRGAPGAEQATGAERATGAGQATGAARATRAGPAAKRAAAAGPAAPGHLPAGLPPPAMSGQPPGLAPGPALPWLPPGQVPADAEPSAAPGPGPGQQPATVQPPAARIPPPGAVQPSPVPPPSATQPPRARHRRRRK